MRVKTTIVLLAVAASLVLPHYFKEEGSQRSTDKSPASYNLPPNAEAGLNFITFVGLLTEFRGSATAPEAEIVSYAWDFDGDGVYDFQSSKTGLATYVYPHAGVYQASLRVYDGRGQEAIDAITVTVKAGTGRQEFLPAYKLKPGLAPAAAVPGDGIVDRYVVMINGGAEIRFWNDVTYLYSTLINDYKYSPERIYLLNYDGTNLDGLNPDGMIDSPASLPYADTVFTELATLIDRDDELLVWVTDHGRGYCGPKLDCYGYVGGRISVDSGDEQDYLERDFKLRSLMTGGNYADFYYNHGLNQLKVFYYPEGDRTRMYRHKFVSTFNQVYFEGLGERRSDSDVYIERLVNYLLGDTNRDGYIETSQGEVYDYDGDEKSPYDPITGVFDEDDWGSWDYYEDNFNYINSGYPGTSYVIFDANFDNHLDIDFNYDPNHLEVDGTDLDNQGLFDGIDVNDDGDMDDWISIDEVIHIATAGPDIYDDDLATLLGKIAPQVSSVIMEPCFSGGFVDDLSAPRRVIVTATEEETESWGADVDFFVELFTDALHRQTRYGVPVNADSNENGHISIREAFNYAAQHDDREEIPQYDDNGDGVSHPYPIPEGGEGNLGPKTYLESYWGLRLRPVMATQSGSPGSIITYTLQVTNTGDVPDTFDVSASGYTWKTNVPAAVGPVTRSHSTALVVTVTIPLTVTDEFSDTAAIIVTSRGDKAKTATTQLISLAQALEPSTRYLFLPMILK